MDKELYKPFKSSAKNKKYSVYVMKDGKKRLIHFGDSRYSQFKDKLGEYKKLDIFLKNNWPQQINDMVEIIWAYYRWEVERLNMEWKFSEVERYQWLVDFSQAIRDYQEYVLTQK